MWKLYVLRSLPVTIPQLYLRKKLFFKEYFSGGWKLALCKLQLTISGGGFHFPNLQHYPIVFILSQEVPGNNRGLPGCWRKGSWSISACWQKSWGQACTILINKCPLLNWLADKLEPVWLENLNSVLSHTLMLRFGATHCWKLWRGWVDKGIIWVSQLISAYQFL